MKNRMHSRYLLALALVLLPVLAMAQQPARIGVVNLGRLLTESPQAAAAEDALQEEFAPRQNKLIAQKNAFEEKQKQVQRDVEVMGPEERRNAERDLRKEERDLSRSVDELNEDANLRRNEELGKVQREVLLEAVAYAREQGFDVVLGQGVIYASPSVDITNQVLERLKAKAGAPAGSGN